MECQAKKSAAKKVQNNKGGAKDFEFEACIVEIQAQPRKTRAAVWQEWMKFNVAVVREPHEVEVVCKGQEFCIIRIQWAETVKDAHKRRDKDYEAVSPLLKSRLLGCGNLEETDGLRTDRPVADVDARSLVPSWCASTRATLRSADMSDPLQDPSGR